MARVVPLLIALAALVIPSSARAGFTPIIDLPSGVTSTRDPQLSASPDGSAVLLYVADHKVLVAQKQPGALFGAPVQLGTGVNAHLATAASGQAVVAWVQSDGSVRAALRQPGGAFVLVPASLGTAYHSTNDFVGAVTAAIAPNGRVYVGYATQTNGTMVTLAPNSTSPVAATTIATSSSFGTELAIGPLSDVDGASFLVTTGGGLSSSVAARRWSSTLGQGATTTLSTLNGHNTSGSGFGSVVAYSAGHPLAVAGPHPSFFWVQDTSDFEDATQSTTHTAQIMRADEPFSGAPVAVDSDTGSQYNGGDFTAPASTTDPNGQTTVAWARIQPGGTIRRTVRPSPGGAFGPALALPGLTAQLDDIQIPDLAVVATGGGNAQVLFPSYTSVFTAPVTAAGVLPQTEPTVLEAPSTTAQFSGTAASGTGTGDAAMAWTSANLATVATTVRLVLTDVTPPTITIAPDAGPVGDVHTFAFDADAADTWTPTTVTWDFGDGSIASGTHVTHTFATAGTFTITATATDAGGNTTRVTTTRTVADPATGGGSGPPATSGGASPAAPVVTGLGLSAKRFAVVPAKGRPKKGQGTTVRFTLSAATPVDLSVARTTSGYAKGSACTTKKPKGKHPKRCTIRRAVGVLRVAGTRGANAVAFGGTVAGKRLAPGTYELSAGAVAAGASRGTGGPTVPFTVVR